MCIFKYKKTIPDTKKSYLNIKNLYIYSFDFPIKLEKKLDILTLIEDEDYRLRNVPQPVPQGRSADSAFGEGKYSTKKSLYAYTRSF